MVETSENWYDLTEIEQIVKQTRQTHHKCVDILYKSCLRYLFWDYTLLSSKNVNHCPIIYWVNFYLSKSGHNILKSIERGIVFLHCHKIGRIIIKYTADESLKHNWLKYNPLNHILGYLLTFFKGIFVYLCHLCLTMKFHNQSSSSPQKTNWTWY